MDREKVVENNINRRFFRMEGLLQSKPDGFASSLGEGAFGKERKLYRTAKGPISERAVTEGDWRS